MCSSMQKKTYLNTERRRDVNRTKSISSAKIRRIERTLLIFDYYQCNSSFFFLETCDVLKWIKCYLQHETN